MTNGEHLRKRFAYRLTFAIVAMVLGAVIGGGILRADVPQVATGSWMDSGPFADLPSGAASAVLPDGTVVVAGGQLPDGRLNEGIALYDPARGEWTRAGALMEPRAGLAAAALADGRVVFAGGRTAAGVTASVEVFDPQDGSSVPAGEMMLQRADAAAATLPDGRVLIAGGTDGSGPLAAAELFDPQTGDSQFAASLAIARTGLSATTLLDGHVLVAGGNDGQRDLSIAEIYDPELGIFWETEWMHTARSRHVAMRLPGSNTVLVAGGVSNGAALKSAEQYAHWGQLWLAYEPLMSTARVGAIAAPTTRPGVVLIAGGGDSNGEFYGYATVGTDKADYAPYETVTISGSGWQPGETVHLRVSEDSDSHYDWELEAVADEFGNIINREFYPREDDVYHHMGMRFYATAHGIASEAETTFTDGGTLTIAFAGDGSGSVHGEGAGKNAFDCSTNCTGPTYTSSGSVTLTATPAADSTFVKWSDNVECDNKGCSVQMKTNQIVTATFNKKAVTKEASTTRVTVSDASYDGLPHGGTALTTGPNGLSQALEVTYEGRNSTVYGPSTTAPTNAGDYTARASFTETAEYSGSSDSKNFSIAKAESTVTVTFEVGPYTYRGTPFTATAKVTGDGSLNESLAVSYTGDCTNVTPTGCSASASFAGDANHTASSNSASIAIEKAPATIHVTDLVHTFDGTPKGATVTSTPAALAGLVVTYDGSAVVPTTVKAGGYQVVASLTNQNYQAPNATGTLVIAPATPVITWEAPSKIIYGTLLDGTHLNASANVAGQFTYTPPAGTKLTAGVHQLSVSFTPTDAVNYATVSKSVSIKVDQATPVITWDAPAAIIYGTLLDVTQLNATADVDGTLTYAPVTGTKLNAGMHQLSVTFTPADTVNYTSPTKSVSIEVVKATPVITWNAPADITYGTPLSSVQLNATSSVEGEFVYAPALGVVLDAGQQQVLSVKFMPNDSANYNEVDSTTVAINVGKATPHVTVYGGTRTYNASPYVVTGAAMGVKGASLTPVSVAYYEGEAELAGAPVDAGTYSVVAHFAGSANYEAADSTRATIVITPATPVVTATGGTFTYDGNGHPGSGSAIGVNDVVLSPVTLTHAQNGAPIAGIPTNAAGYTVTAHFAGSRNYVASHSEPAVITIKKATPVVNWSDPSDIVYGTLLASTQLNATANVGGTFAYSPAAGTKLNAGPAQKLSVTFTPADGANYTAASGEATLNVLKVRPTVTVNWVGGSFTGNAFQADGWVTGVGSPAEALGKPDGYDYYAGQTIAAGTFLGTTAPVNVGTYTVSAFYKESDNYLSAEGYATITIGAWSAQGFYSPIANGSSIVLAPGAGAPLPTSATVWNSSKGGSTIPLKFDVFPSGLSRAESTNVADVISVVPTMLNTCTVSQEDQVDYTDQSGITSALFYDGEQFHLNWKTPSVKTDTCYRVTATLRDQTKIHTFIKLKK